MLKNGYYKVKLRCVHASFYWLKIIETVEFFLLKAVKLLLKNVFKVKKVYFMFIDTGAIYDLTKIILIC